MTSWSSGSVEDPEKHFLGNLLDDETSFSASPGQNPRGVSETTTSAVPRISVINSVGPIHAPSTDRPSCFWPEPPPPYSPEPFLKDASIPSPWNLDSIERASESSVQYDSLIDPGGLKEPSTWDSLLDFSPPFPPPNSAQQKPTEIHHHQHTHQHTHVMQVQVINKHHYPTSPDVSPLSTPYESGSPEFASVVRRATTTPELKRPQHLPPHSAPVVHKMPFSYRDVAASKMVHSNGLSPTQTGRKATTPTEGEAKLEPARSTESIASDGSKNSYKDSRQKTEPEFQKISRKKGAKEKRAMSDSSAPPQIQPIPVVDVPTRYQVLEKLSSPKIVKTDSVDSDDVVFTTKAEKIDDSDLSPPRAKKIVVQEIKKKPIPPPAPKKRTCRKKNESDNWIFRYIWSYLELLVDSVGDSLKWLMVLVVDVCSRSGELFLLFMQNVYDSFVDFFKGIGHYILGCILSVFYTCRQLSLRQMFLSPPTDAVWGLDENMALPSTTEEALERLLRVRRVDAYAILGLRSDCNDEDIHRHHHRLRSLLNMDKAPMEGMEEAESLIETAYALIRTADSREDYNENNLGKNPMHNDLLDFWDTLRMKVEESRHTMLCDCGKRHARIPTAIKTHEARYCKRCGTKHPARANDLWCETRLLGVALLYYTCSDGVIYDISEWASCECQNNYLKNMKPNAHIVQYRLVSPGTPIDKSQQALQDLWEEAAGGWAAQLPSNSSIRAQAQVFRPMEPRDEDRSRRAANRRQKNRR